MKYSIFGESHGPAIGVVLEGVPPGLALDLDAVRFDLSRRAPGKNALSTPRTVSYTHLTLPTICSV